MLKATHLRDAVDSQDKLAEDGIGLLHAIVKVDVALTAQTREVKLLQRQTRIHVVVALRDDVIVAAVVSLAALVYAVEQTADGLISRSSRIPRPTEIREHSDLEAEDSLVTVL